MYAHYFNKNNMDRIKFTIKKKRQKKRKEKEKKNTRKS